MARPKHGYTLADGKTKVPGVTTILGRFKESGGLLNWAFQQGASGAASLYEKRDEAGEVGTYAHALVDAKLRGETLAPERPKGMTDEQAAQAWQACAAFDEWRENSKLTITSMEMPLVSETYKFGGTPDGEAESPKGLAIADWKTGNGIYPEMLLQLVAYDILINECTGLKMDGGYHLVRFGKESARFTHMWIPANDPLIPIAKKQFLRLREAWEDDRILRKFAA
jgi:hypothetical protein